MKKIGIFLDEIKDQSIDIGEKFEKIAHNTGNMLFWHSLKATFDLEVISRWYLENPDQLDPDDYKAFITTDLIWILEMEDYSYLNNVLNFIGDLPLIPISIGLQAKNFDPDFRLHPETVKVLRRISERCVMGVRGNYTAEILTKYGITNFEVIGCPSMYMPGVDFSKISNAPKNPEKVTANFETFYDNLDIHKTDFLNYCAERNFGFVEQTQALPIADNFPDGKTLSKIKGWIDAQGNCFFDIDEWREYMRGFDFSLGMRFHGNVMALWEGVPALFIICDSRTKELCNFYSLPSIDIEEFDPEKPVEYYYGLADFAEFRAEYPDKQRKWEGFLKVNGFEKEKIIYHCITAYQLLEIIIHKNLYHRSAECAVLVPDNFENLVPQIKDFCGCGYFDKVIYIDPMAGFDGTKEEMTNSVIKYYDDIFSENGIDIGELSDIVIAGSYRNFGLYASLKGCDFSIFEDAAGTLTSDSQLNYDLNNNKAHAELLLENGLYHGDNAHIKQIYCVRRCQNEAKLTGIADKINNFVVKEKFAELPEDIRNNILKLYSVDSDMGDISVVFTQWFIFDNVISQDKRIILHYQYLCDIFAAGDNIFIKIHPNDPIDYNGYFEKCVISKSKYPAELLSFANNNVNKVITISSTASSAFPEAVNVSVMCNPFAPLPIYNRLLVIGNIIKALSGSKVFCYGIDEKFVNRFYLYLLGNDYDIQWRMPVQMTNTGNSVLIIDALNWGKGTVGSDIPSIIEAVPEDTVFIFLNRNKEDFWDISLNEMTKYAIPLGISKAKLKPDTIYSDYDDEYIWIFCKNAEIRSLIMVLSYEYELPNVGIRIKSGVTKDSAERKILDAKLNVISAHYAEMIGRQQNEINMLKEIIMKGGDS